MFEERLETIRSVCERLQLQPNRQKLRIKNNRHYITSHNQIDKSYELRITVSIPSDAQIIGETELHYLVRH